MSKWEIIKVALLGAIAISGAVTAYEVRKIAEEGFEVELTQAEEAEIMDEVEASMAEAFEDMEGECDEE